jgi:hypothetical protein
MAIQVIGPTKDEGSKGIRISYNKPVPNVLLK